MMKKLGLTVMGVVAIGIISFGCNFYTNIQRAADGDTPAPMRDTLTYGNSGSLVENKIEDHGRTPTPLIDKA
ncbi:Phr family secreted Rap phosphatase inhibitor [Bacillus sp. KbaB1]|uniref:Phr family secreted Rap phosphatase inhibitor n=1 Tax=Bacillus sp. KbaB1 TaxID=1972845 RepID=UPI000B7EC81F|nr:Phr family secreted Rap phosphatase inhibitor [Bacillus sp. KbaB1]OXL97092.1 hypothetical protein B6N65_17555 [Bacillus sp. KbaB1]